MQCIVCITLSECSLSEGKCVAYFSPCPAILDTLQKFNNKMTALKMGVGMEKGNLYSWGPVGRITNDFHPLAQGLSHF